MVRQAHTYLVGAMGGATLIAIAVVLFVVLVSAQVFKDWPIAALGSGSDASAVSAAHATRGPRAAAPASGSAVRSGPGASGNHHARHAGSDGSVAPNNDLASAGGDSTGTSTEGPAGSGGSGGGGGSEAPGSNPSPGASNPATGTSSGGGGSGGNRGSGSTSNPVTSTVEKVTETVNGTVTKVDETALGGALGSSSVTEVTEGVVNGTVGPESAVGHVVEETAGAVGGLLHGDH